MAENCLLCGVALDGDAFSSAHYHCIQIVTRVIHKLLLEFSNRQEQDLQDAFTNSLWEGVCKPLAWGLQVFQSAALFDSLTVRGSSHVLLPYALADGSVNRCFGFSVASRFDWLNSSPRKFQSHTLCLWVHCKCVCIIFAIFTQAICEPGYSGDT